MVCSSNFHVLSILFTELVLLDSGWIVKYGNTIATLLMGFLGPLMPVLVKGVIKQCSQWGIPSILGQDKDGRYMVVLHPLLPSAT